MVVGTPVVVVVVAVPLGTIATVAMPVPLTPRRLVRSTRGMDDKSIPDTLGTVGVWFIGTFGGGGWFMVLPVCANWLSDGFFKPSDPVCTEGLGTMCLNASFITR